MATIITGTFEAFFFLFSFKKDSNSTNSHYLTPNLLSSPSCSAPTFLTHFSGGVGGSRNKLSIHEWGRGAFAQVSTGTRVIYCYIKFDGKKPLNKNPERLDSRTKEQQDIFICKIS